MTPSAEDSRTPQLLLASRVAWLHYMEGLTNLDIADRLGISRFRVARLLDRARKSGIVQISVSSPLEVDQELSSQLVREYGLAEALVFPAIDGPDDGPHRQLIGTGVGRLAARFLADILNDGAKFGVTWGNTLEQVARALGSVGAFPRCDVVQLVGGISAAGSSMMAMDVLSRFTTAAGGTFSSLDAPLVVSDVQAAEAFRGQASIKNTLSQVSGLDAAIVGIGSWSPPVSQLIPLFDKGEITQALERGAVADVCAIVVDKDGDEVTEPFAKRVIRADSDRFRKIPYVIGVVSGVAKTHAVHAVLTGKWINVLVTDSLLARRLLTEPA